MAIRGVLNLKMACLLSRTRSLSHTTRPSRSAHLSATSAEDTPAEPFPPQRFRNKHKRSRNPITRSKGNKKKQGKNHFDNFSGTTLQAGPFVFGNEGAHDGRRKNKKEKRGEQRTQCGTYTGTGREFPLEYGRAPAFNISSLCPLLPHCPLEGAGGRWFVHELRLEQKSIGDSLQSRTHERVKTYGSTNPPE